MQMDPGPRVVLPGSEATLLLSKEVVGSDHSRPVLDDSPNHTIPLIVGSREKGTPSIGKSLKRVGMG